MTLDIMIQEVNKKYEECLGLRRQLSKRLEEELKTLEKEYNKKHDECEILYQKICDLQALQRKYKPDDEEQDKDKSRRNTTGERKCWLSDNEDIALQSGIDDWLGF